MRTFERTHPWIKFVLDLRPADYNLWIALGEAVSKCEHLAGVPLQPNTAQRMHSLYLAKGIRATTAIEGNTLTEEEVLDRIEGKSSLPPSREYLGKEVDNILKGCNQIKAKLMKGESGLLSLEEIREFNKTVLEGVTFDNSEIMPGKIRNYSVGVSAYRGAPCEDCEYLLEKMCEWLNSDVFSPTDNLIMFGILRAIVAHLYIAWIHPFGDGNGRTARLIEFKILLSTGIPTPAAHLLSNHYNLTRTEYYRQLDYTSKSGGNIIPFIKYAVQGFVDGLKEQIKVVQKQQLAVAWRDYIYEKFKDMKGDKNIRRRNLVLDFSNKSKPVPFNEIKEISPRIAESFTNKTVKTIRRDLIELISMGLLKRIESGYIANSEIMLSFLPERRNNKI